jgi:CubicO group peptidase (beta-lactamase class C family)
MSIRVTITIACILTSFGISNAFSPYPSKSTEKVHLDILNGKYGKVSGVVVYKSNRIVFENYYGFSQPNTLHQISSVTKSITSIAVGICLDKGYIQSIKTPIYKYFPDYNFIFSKDSTKKLITIEHLLNQTSGFKWDEWTIHYSYAGNPLIELSHNPNNWMDIILRLPLSNAPGEVFTYNSCNSEILKEIVCRCSGRDFAQLLVEDLFLPLDIHNYYWEHYASNREPAWGGLSLTTRDMAKIGLLALNNGTYRGKQVVSAEWMSKSTKSLVDAGKVNYGLHWWVTMQPDGNTMIYAAGYGDQYIYILPDKAMVIAINAQNFTDFKFDKSIDNLVQELINAIYT